MLYSIFKWLMFLINKIVFRLEIVGSEKIPEDGPIIIVGNHKSNMDPLMICSMVKRKISWMGKKELWENRFLRTILNAVGAFPVDRQGVDIDAIKKSMKILKEGGTLGLFPEGTRVKSFDESRIKHGVALIAQRTNSKVVPIYIEGDYVPFKKMRLIVRDVVDFKDVKKLTSEEYQDLSVEIMKKVYNGD